jgi:hypothetical protein
LKLLQKNLNLLQEGQWAEGRTALSLLYCLKFEGDYNLFKKISATVKFRDGMSYSGSHFAIKMPITYTTAPAGRAVSRVLCRRL